MRVRVQAQGAQSGTGLSESCGAGALGDIGQIQLPICLLSICSIQHFSESTPPEVGPQRTLGKCRRPWREGRWAGKYLRGHLRGHLRGRLIDATVGHGARAVEIGIVAIMIVVPVVLEALSYILITLACHLVTLRHVDRLCGGKEHMGFEASSPGCGPSTLAEMAWAYVLMFDEAQKFMIMSFQWV